MIENQKENLELDDDDLELVRLIKYSPSEGLEKAIDLYGSSVKVICSSILAGYSQEDVDETISDVFASFWRSIYSYNPSKVGIKSYLYGIARNCAKNKKRSLSKQCKNENIDEIEVRSKEDLEQSVIDNLNKEIVSELIMKLKPPANFIFMYRYFDNLKLEEIAQILNISVKKVENTLYRYTKKLKKEFEKRRILM